MGAQEIVLDSTVIYLILKMSSTEKIKANINVLGCLLCAGFSLWTITHAEACQVPITEGKEDHEEDKEAVVMENDRQVGTRVNVAQHEERDEDQATPNGCRKYHTVFSWLEKKEYYQLTSFSLIGIYRAPSTTKCFMIN